MSSNLVGLYQIDKSNLLKQSENLHLVIGTRKQPTPTKPKYYLLQRLPNNRHIYVSSLFDAPQWAENGLQVYSLDWQGVNLKLTMNQTAQTAAILPSSNSTSSINNVELGVKFTTNAGL
jgi:hypothetical protein